MKKRNFKILTMVLTLCLMLSIFSISVSAASTLSTPKAKITAYTTPALKVSWDAVTNANMYYVYRSKGNETKMTVVAKTSKLYYKDTDIVKNVVYSYKIKALNIKGGKTKGTSALSTAVKKAVVDVSIPTNVKAKTVSNSQIKLSWNKVSGADKYNLYYSTKINGTYTSIGYTKNTNYTFSKLTSSTTYYFKVKASKTLDGKNYTSKYSSIASAKTQSKAGEYIVDFERISTKEAGLPTGSAMCCLAMVLNFNGANVTPKELVPYFNCSTEFYKKDGVLYGPLADNHFIGDPYSEKAYVYGAEAWNMGKAGDNYISDNNLSIERELSLSQFDFDNVKSYIKSNKIAFARIVYKDYCGAFEWHSIDKGTSYLNIFKYNEKNVIIFGVTDTDIITYDPAIDKVERYKFTWGATIANIGAFNKK